MAETALDDEEIKEYFDSPDLLDQKVTHLADLIQRSRHFVAYTGAGISTSAGISDFRGPDGVWTREAKGLEYSIGDWSNAKPTLCHMALVALQDAGRLKFLVSQNCDGLHIKSGISPDKISELHGNCYVEACSLCGDLFYRSYPVRTEPNPACTTERKCAKCNIPLRYTTVAFGQSMPDLSLTKAQAQSENADLSLCLGTSMRVTPACLLPLEGRGNPGFNLVIVNLQKTPYDKDCSIRIFARSDDAMALLLHKLQLTARAYAEPGPRDDRWMALFKTHYKFRSAGTKDWFQGAHNGVDLKLECPACEVILRYPEGAKKIQCPRCTLLIDIY